MPTKKIKHVQDTDIQPLETQKATGRLLFQPWLEFEIEIVGSLHCQAQQMAQVSLLLAAKAGAKLSAIKDRCEHGEWQKVIAALPFSSETARRYRALADELQDRMNECGNPFDLLALPEPEHFCLPEYADQINQIQQVTGEQTLRQLYFDWGICKTPKALGGYHPGKPPVIPEGETLLHMDACSALGRLLKELDAVALCDRRILPHLRIKELQVLEGDLVDALKHVRTVIKAG